MHLEGRCASRCDSVLWGLGVSHLFSTLRAFRACRTRSLAVYLDRIVAHAKLLGGRRPSLAYGWQPMSVPRSVGGARVGDDQTIALSQLARMSGCHMTPPRSFRSTVVVLRQTRRAEFRSLTAVRGAIMHVHEGEKVVRGPHRSFRIGSGSLAVLPPQTALTIENRPGPEGRYLARAMVPDPGLIDQAIREGLPPGDPFVSTTSDRALAAFERAAAALEDPLMPAALQDHAVREVLLWLGQEGIGFGPGRRPSFVERLRPILAAEPDVEWRAARAARALAVSEPTLRRRLAMEGTTFSDLLADVRMTHALGLLQATETPVNRIALDCGYQSASRFAIRFRKRFGIAPSDIRNRTNEQNSTVSERNGAATAE
ncbi:MAG: helix-turn-helix transcriptional regulator [Pseudomonadota bacterium]|nr:helix-turn-helix transcriptional regulator [Pseudomonadota bacterium]